MLPRPRMYALVALALTAATAPVLLPPSVPAHSVTTRKASLHVSPRIYVGGQKLTFAGNIGRNGKRRVKLQLNLSRPGDQWKDLPGFHKRYTRANGHFRFRYRAPAMFGMRMRVVSGRLATPARTFHARSQDLVLRAVGPYEDGRVVAGAPFDVRVDTTPTDLARRTDLPPPIFVGRELTLQRRVGEQWEHVASSVTDAAGNGVFRNVVASAQGTEVYRVRQEDWTAHGDRVGWYPSFPTYVDVVSSATAAARSASRAPVESDAAPAERGIAGGTLLAARDVASRTASQTFHWTPSLWDFGWTFGESLTTRPSRGTDRHGYWLDSSDGTGRAARHNGGLMLDSQRQNKDGLGDSWGTTRVTMRDNPMKYGRWEVRLRMKSTQRDYRDYTTKIELVPDRPEDYHCGAQNITVASVSPHSSGIDFGARALGGREWTGTEPGVSVNGSSHALAVEVTRRHVTWFLEGRPIGTVRTRAAVPDVPLTLRISMEGQGQQKMNRAQSIFDWMRGFSLAKGHKVARGGSLTSGTHDGGC